MDVNLSLSGAQAQAFEAALFLYLDTLERDVSPDGCVSVTITPVPDGSQYTLRFARPEDALKFTTSLAPNLPA